jgi:hypothetical protein
MSKRSTIVAAVVVPWLFVVSEARAGVVVYVDDTPTNNGSVACPARPGTTNPTTIEEGITALGNVKVGATLYVCPGQYALPGAGYRFNGYTSLRIIGLGSPTISAPAGFSGYALSVETSSSVTIQGLVFDGRRNVSDGGAIVLFGASGVVQQNTITGWHQPYATPWPFLETGRSFGILVTGAPPAGAGIVQVLRNNIYDGGDVGIFVASPRARIAGNRITFSSGIVAVLYDGTVLGNHSGPIQAGVLVVPAGRESVVTANQILSNNDLFPRSYYSRGIMVLGASRTRIVANTVRGTARQISIESNCFAAADANVVTANRLYDTSRVGVFVGSTILDAAYCDASAIHADDNQVTSNAIYATGAPDVSGLYAVSLSATLGGRVADVRVTNNTFAGFSETALSRPILVFDPAATPGAVTSPNRALVVPPPGPLR